MSPIIRNTSIVLSVISAALLIGLGCSRDTSVNPADSALTDGVVQTLTADGPVNQLPEPTFVETFDKRSNVGSWSFFGNPDNSVEKWESQDGNPGAFIHAQCDDRIGCLSTYAPQLRTQLGVSSIFTGDYRARKVTMVGVDLAIYGPDWIATENRPLSLVLRNDGGTPEDWADDVVVFWTGSKTVPHECGQFKEFVLPVPSQSETMPKDWGILANWGTGDDDADWNTVITDVSQVNFFFGDPEMAFLIQAWELGFDNVSIWLDE